MKDTQLELQKEILEALNYYGIKEIEDFLKEFQENTNHTHDRKEVEKHFFYLFQLGHIFLTPNNKYMLNHKIITSLNATFVKFDYLGYLSRKKGGPSLRDS